MPGSGLAGIIVGRKRKGNWPLDPKQGLSVVILCLIILVVLFLLLI